MKSLRQLLEAKYSPSPLQPIQRLQLYIEKKYNFTPEIKVSPRQVMTIYVPQPPLVGLVRLDWSNLDRLVGGEYKIQIRLKKSS